MDNYLSIVLYVLLTYTAIHFLLSMLKNRHKKLPPGPYGIPIFGHLFSLGTKPHITLSVLAKRYGPLMILRFGRVQTVVISSPAMAKEALQKNDLSFCDRQILDAVYALDHHKRSVGWMPMGPKWRNLRKICSSHVFSTIRLDASQSIRRNKVKDLLAFVEKSREAGVAVDIGLAAFTTTLNLLSSTFFSVDLGDPSSQVALEYRRITRILVDALGKPNFADYFPILKKIDPQCIKRRIRVPLRQLIDLLNSLIHQRMQEKRAPELVQGNDVLDALLDIIQLNNGEIELSDITHLLVDLFTAGTDTTATIVEWAMAELIHNPDKMTKARAELHEIIGKGNTVEESDIPKLLYLQAVVKEAFRMHPPVPLSVPRKAVTDVNLSGFTVPKNAQLLVNLWGIGRDPNLWENPNSFEPERFLNSDIDVKGHDFELIPFGAGRRMCPGWPLAIRMLHLMLASLIHSFDWKLEGGILPQDMNMEDKFGLTLEKANHLRAIPVHL